MHLALKASLGSLHAQSCPVHLCSRTPDSQPQVEKEVQVRPLNREGQQGWNPGSSDAGTSCAGSRPSSSSKNHGSSSGPLSWCAVPSGAGYCSCDIHSWDDGSSSSPCTVHVLPVTERRVPGWASYPPALTRGRGRLLRLGMHLFPWA